MEAGEIEPLKYRKSLQEEILKSQKLLHFYLLKKAIDHYNYMNMRIEYAKSDLSELDDMIQSGAAKGMHFSLGKSNEMVLSKS